MVNRRRERPGTLSPVGFALPPTGVPNCCYTVSKWQTPATEGYILRLPLNCLTRWDHLT